MAEVVEVQVVECGRLRRSLPGRVEARTAEWLVLGAGEHPAVDSRRRPTAQMRLELGYQHRRNRDRAGPRCSLRRRAQDRAVPELLELRFDLDRAVQEIDLSACERAQLAEAQACERRGEHHDAV